MNEADQQRFLASMTPREREIVRARQLRLIRTLARSVAKANGGK